MGRLFILKASFTIIII